MRIKHLHFLTLFITSTVFAKPLDLSNGDCLKHYKDLFKGDEITVTVVFGYFDSETGSVTDNGSKENFINILKSPCTNWDKKICDFQQIRNYPNHLIKKIFGPDGKIKDLIIKVESSSLTAVDANNRSNPAQVKKTARTRDFFYDGIRNSQVTMYLGHSRDGGGPDFSPPVLRQDGHVDYNHYKKTETEKKQLESVLSEDPFRPRILGLISCSSVKWFSKGIEKASPSSGIIGTDGPFNTSQFLELLPLLEQIFSFKCLDNFYVLDHFKKVKIIKFKMWDIPKNLKGKTNRELQIEAIKELSSIIIDPKVPKHDRDDAYREIRSFSSSLYTHDVNERLKIYKAQNDIH